ncbi:efflux transporter, outer membrane factor (OMF) lipo, NodT family protein [Collimonas fungivorans]|uniref:Efflux transporter, outer membrane factor (OMF) lipo, NodT family protein n=2 Tax=Collimonas fungivorans TaxID=158899 RepID=A0A127PFA3_9BURK|nr:efflux transporter, outer membrane factor (OMF) lipo, NodT family protein [Collimonas fungivorans]
MKNMRYLKPSLCLLACSLLAACSTLHTPYQPVAVTTPPAWQNKLAENAGDAIRQDRWWRNFNDPQLDQLVELALARNNDLAAATVLVRRAQLQAGLAVINPTVALNVSSSNSRNLRGSPVGTRNQALTGSVSYELDLWGKLASRRDAAEWEALATAEDRDSTALALVGTTATLYWKIANLQQRIAVSEQSMAYVGKILELVHLQYDAGAVSSLELLEAERSLASQQASHTQLLQELVETRAALALLFDGPPELRYAESGKLAAAVLPAVDAGLPSQLLGRRPDLHAAELRLRRLLASIDDTRASYYPSLVLTGTLGSSSTALSNLLQNPIGTLGATLAFPFLQWNQMQLNIALSKADYDKAAIDFRQAFYKALNDVETALSARSQFQAQGQKLSQALAAASRIEGLYEERYRAGAVPLKTWLDAQETRRNAEIAVADNNLNLLTSQVKLYQALGGDTVTATASTAAQPPR